MSEDLVGKTLLGKLRVLRRLGAGGMGVVYEVQHVLTKHHRALKVLHPELSASAEAVARLVREAGVAGRIDDPHVVQTYDVGRLDDGCTYILMELLDGRTLRALLKERGRLDVDLASEIVAQACRGLEAVHAAGIVHRDLKPENIFLARDGASGTLVKILDFGVMAFADGTSDSLGELTGTGQAAGTPQYMAPEQIEGVPVDARVDIHAMGVILYEAVAGRLPFVEPSIGALLRSIHHGDHPPLRSFAPDVSPAFEQLVHRAMHRDPAARYGSAGELVGAIQSLPSAPGPPLRLSEAVSVGEPVDPHASTLSVGEPVDPHASTLSVGEPVDPHASTLSVSIPPREPEPSSPLLQAGGSAQFPGGNRYLAARFDLIRCIKSGGMGSVYEVIHRDTRRRRALKVMLPALVSDEQMRARFRQEATIAADIDSEHIVETLDAGIDPDTGTPFLLMELLQGEELGTLLKRRGPLEPAEVVVYLAQVARALDRAHAAGIIHRDLKPENLFVTYRDDGSPRLKILDFGIAKLVAQGTRAAGSTAPIGTPLYMAPEQLEADGTLGSASDTYSLAQIAYALLTGEPYFTTEARGGVYPLLLRIAVGGTEPPTARAARRGVTLAAGFDVWFKRAAAVDPAARFQRAGDLVAALAEVLGVRAPASPVVPPRPQDPTPGPSSARRRPWAWAVVLAALSGSVVVWSGLGSGTAPGSGSSPEVTATQQVVVATAGASSPVSPPPAASTGVSIAGSADAPEARLGSPGGSAGASGSVLAAVTDAGALPPPRSAGRATASAASPPPASASLSAPATASVPAPVPIPTGTGSAGPPRPERSRR